MVTKDSVGNELPKSVYLLNNATPDQLSHALATNSFLLACSIAITEGKTVIYNKREKSATITNKDGTNYIVMHS